MTAEGYIRLWRKLIGSSIWQGLTPAHFQVAVGLLLIAQWRGGFKVCSKCKQRYIVPPGGIPFGHRPIAKELGLDSQVVLRALNNCMTLEFISKPEANHCHVLYVVENWAEYQSELETPNPEQSTERTQSKALSNAPEKKGKKDKKEKTYPSEVLTRCARWFDHLLELELQDEGDREAVIDAWSKDMDLLHRVDMGGDWAKVDHLLDDVLAPERDGFLVCRDWVEGPAKLRRRRHGVKVWRDVQNKARRFQPAVQADLLDNKDWSAPT